MLPQCRWCLRTCCLYVWGCLHCIPTYLRYSVTYLLMLPMPWWWWLFNFSREAKSPTSKFDSFKFVAQLAKTRFFVWRDLDEPDQKQLALSVEKSSRWPLPTSYLLTYMPTYIYTDLHTYLLTYLPTYIHTSLLSYLPTYLLKYPPTYLYIHLPPYIPTYLPTSYLPTYLPPTYLHT